MRGEYTHRIEFILSLNTARGSWLADLLGREENRSDVIREALIAWYENRPAPPDPTVAELARELVHRDREINNLRADIAQLQADREYFQRALGDCEQELVNAHSGLLGRLRRD